MSLPPLHRKATRSIQEMRGLARLVGGKDGRRLSAYILAAANGQGGPDLTIHTRKPVTAQAAAVLDTLGAFRPDHVSIETMKRMRLDPQIQLALAATKAPILSAPIFFESTSREAIALCEAAWNDSGILRELQRTSLNAIDFGFSAHEKLWEAMENYTVDWTVPGATVGVMEPKSKTYPIAFLPKRAKDLDPSMVTLLCDEFGRFKGLVHGSPPASMADIASRAKDVLLPEKCFVFTINEEFGNIYGRARQVSAYDPWYWQRILYLITNRWYERKSDPAMVGYAPSDPMLMDPGTDENTDYDENDAHFSPILRLRSLMTNALRASGIMVLPSEPYKDDNGKPSTVRAYDVKELGLEDVHPAFLAYHQHLDAKKTRAMLVPDGAIAASENSGTYGSTKTLSELAISIQNESLSSWVRHYNRYYLQPFCAYNGIKDRVTARTTGISSDSRDILARMAEKTYEADMLLEQAWGPQLPDSLTRLVSRRKILRSLNIPYEEPSPDAPAPEMPEPPPQPTPAAGEAKGNASKGKGKTKTGLGARKETRTGKHTGRERPFRLAAAAPEFESWAVDTADAFETKAANAAQTAPYRKTLTTREKAVAALLLWFLLRADKTDAKGKKVRGLTSVDDFVFEAGSRFFASPEQLAAALSDLERLASNYEGKGYRIAPTTATKTYMKRAEAGIGGMLKGMPDDIAESLDPEAYLNPAIDEAQVAMRNLAERFDPGAADALTMLDLSERDAILALNARGLLWNIENISIRSTRTALEKMLNSVGNKRLLGVVNDAATLRFNQLYSDLSLEAHYRAVFRAAMADLAEKNGYTYLLMVSPRGATLDSGAALAGTVRTAEEWDRIAEDQGQPNAVRQFGFHPGSKSFWFPVPTSARLRPGVDLAVRYLSLQAAKAKVVDTGRP